MINAAESNLEGSHLQASFVGSRIDIRELERGETIALSPLTVHAGERGHAVLFRYGAVVLVNLSPEETSTFLKSLTPLVTDRFETPETEDLTIALAADQNERVDADGTLRLRDLGLERLHVVAHILAKTVVLAHYEERVATIFDRIEQLVEQLRSGAGKSISGREILSQMGEVLIVQTQTVGRVEVTEKPEITWDHPALDRLYERLSLEYELRDRDQALTRKLEFVSHTAQTYLDLLQTRQALRLEWYIVVLILAEIVLIVYDLFVKS